MTYTAEDIKLAYQQGYTHGANGQPPLEGPEVARMIRLLKPDPAICPHDNHATDCTVCNPEGEVPCPSSASSSPFSAARTPTTTGIARTATTTRWRKSNKLNQRRIA